jgi:peroxiredoxin
VSGELRKLLVLVLLGCLLTAPVSGDQTGREAWNFQLRDTNGKAFTLSDFKTKIIVLEFFASWCGPCKPQMAELKEIRSTYLEDEVAIISVSFDPSTDTDDALNRLAKEVGATWTLARDTIGISDKYEVNIAPTIFLIDKAFTIRFAHSGLTRSKVLTPEIDQLLSEPPPAKGATASSDLTWILLTGLTLLIAGSILAIRRRRVSTKSRRKR